MKVARGKAQENVSAAARILRVHARKTVDELNEGIRGGKAVFFTGAFVKNVCGAVIFCPRISVGMPEVGVVPPGVSVCLLRSCVCDPD
jgi:hypothetical protein